MSKIKDKKNDGAFLTDEELPELEEGYLEFNNEDQAKSKLDTIDQALGYLIEDGEGGFYRPFQTKTAMQIIKHPSEEKWAIDIRKISGTKHQKKEKKILSQIEKNAMKKKNVMQEEGWFSDE